LTLLSRLTLTEWTLTERTSTDISRIEIDRIISLCLWLMACCLLPEKKVRKGYKAVRAYAKNKKLLKLLSKLFKYYEDYWLDIEGPATFSVFGYKNRTNNALESFHRHLMRLIKIPHPNIWLFLGIFLLFINCHTVSHNSFFQKNYRRWHHKASMT
jgi:hypothetical protein